MASFRLGAIVREYRTKNKLTQEEFAAVVTERALNAGFDTGMDNTAVCRLERKQLARIDADTLVKLSLVVDGIDAGNLLSS